MSKILQATSRGQVTLPKAWRDQYKTQYFVSEVQGAALLIKPLMQEDFGDSVESAWADYKKGNYVASEELMKKYGL
ncbi:MAG: AbrB/MazE/SpoVT family DNA-binding domain-containing protein [Candidatus Gracilibacteria bacterium]|jgi:bifunctional DNA-binding transcriptional regulator/antitoxin component of YhaV-PrlF toxin-antitoxin module